MASDKKIRKNNKKINTGTPQTASYFHLAKAKAVKLASGMRL